MLANDLIWEIQDTYHITDEGAEEDIENYGRD